MKYAFAAVALAASVYAQDIGQIPSCALPCIQEAVESGTTCSISDYPCICANQDALTAGATSCVIDACGATVAAGEVLPAVDNFCDEVAAAPSSSAPASSAAPSTSAPASTSAAAPSTSAAAPSTSLSASGTVAPPSSTVAATTSAASAYPTSAASSTLATTSHVNGTASATTAAPTSVVTAGAAVAGSIGSLAMMALGLAAAL